MIIECHKCAQNINLDDIRSHFKSTCDCVICGARSGAIKNNDNYCKKCNPIKNSLCLSCVIEYKNNKQMTFNCDMCNNTTNILESYRGICETCQKIVNVAENPICKSCMRVSLNDGYCGKCKPYKCDTPDCNNYCTIYCVRFAGNVECNTCYDKNTNKVNCTSFHEKCMLDNKCCLCNDKRFCNLNNVGYDGYIDGIGFVRNKSRSDFYCTSCISYISHHNSIVSQIN